MHRISSPSGSSRSTKTERGSATTGSRALRRFCPLPAFAANDVYVGSSNGLYHFDGSKWAQVISLTGVAVSSVAVIGSFSSTKLVIAGTQYGSRLDRIRNELHALHHATHRRAARRPPRSTVSVSTAPPRRSPRRGMVDICCASTEPTGRPCRRRSQAARSIFSALAPARRTSRIRDREIC